MSQWVLLSLLALFLQDASAASLERFQSYVRTTQAVDAIFIAAPEHWHAPDTIMARAAGKHVYVEKPGSHNGRESELMVAAARKYERHVQMGNQRRSWPWVIDPSPP